MFFASVCAATLAGLIVALSDPLMDEDLFELCYPVDGDEQQTRRTTKLQPQILDSRMEVLLDGYAAHFGA